MTPGLYQGLAGKFLRLSELQEIEGRADELPHIRHRAGGGGEILNRDIIAMEEAIHENEQMIREIQGLLNRFHVFKTKSRHRSLVITHLEDAQDRLRRELGS